MKLSEGQTCALAQLNRIANTDHSPVSIVGIRESEQTDARLEVDITLDCTHYGSVDGGLPLHDREGFTLSIPRDFPFKQPSVCTAHSRFLGFPHVQWGRQLCLYQSSETQWIPSWGMMGLVAQLDEWLRRAARDELDDPEGALHPPVAYTVASTTICVNADTPPRNTWPWFGAAVLNRRKPNLIEVNEWKSVNQLVRNQLFAPAILLKFELPFEYPKTVKELLLRIEEGGIPPNRILVYLMLASTRVAPGNPLYFGIGGPSRGIAGDIENRRQHLNFWEIEQDDVGKLCVAAIACHIQNRFEGQDIPAQIRELIDPVFAELFRWQQEAKVRWCRAIENRPEIVTRRDKGCSMEWFRGKRVALWGCGAIGGLIAEHLARADVAQLTLYDNGRVNPGILVRQNFVHADIDDPKVDALKRRLESIAPSMSVIAKCEDLVTGTLNRPDWDANIDILIDATASLSVRSKLEFVLKTQECNVPVASLMISGNAELALVAFAPPTYRAGPFDVLRRLGIASINRDWLKGWAAAFWTNDIDNALRQPEPGCSAPTFVASHADVAGLAARALNVLAKRLQMTRDVDANGFLISQSASDYDHQFRFRPDIRCATDGLNFRLSANAWRDMLGWVSAGSRERNSKHETGGLLFGEFDEVLGIAWVSNVSGPPKDSKFSPTEFNLGIQGISDLSNQYAQKTHGMVRYIGTWHTHPGSSPNPSETDLCGIAKIFAETPSDSHHHLMIIVGQAATQTPQIGMYAFEKERPYSHLYPQKIIQKMRGAITKPLLPEKQKRKIGLSLSGGGSRAVAFHLGVLRALEDLDMLDEVDVISSVSGGSIIAGIFGYSQEQFFEIDQRVVDFLRRGLISPILYKSMNPKRLMLLLWSAVAVSLPTLLIKCLSKAIGGTIALVPSKRTVSNNITYFSRSLRRRYSRTHVMADALADVVGNQMCDSPTRQEKSIVFNACELRTGTAFRMNNERFGSWRYGWAHARKLRVADAVTASAAYPPLLPPFDWALNLEKDGKTRSQRVIVADGGVFDNSGVSVMEPGRDSCLSAISYNPNIIIASDAGFGQFVGESVPTSWSDRMIRTFAAVMRKVQDATKKRLHDYAASGRIDGFVYINLGQIDDEVHVKSCNWVDRSSAIRYPTNFSRMSDNDIRMLSGRGEAVARALVTRYLLSD